MLHREPEAAPDEQTAAVAARLWVQAQPLAVPWEQPQEEVVARAEPRRVVAVPWARLQAVEAEPSVQRLAVVEAQPLGPPEAAAVQPSEVRVAVEVLRAERQAAAEVRHAAVLAEEAVQPSVEQAAAQAQLSEARAVRLSAAPSVRSDRQARAQLARRRMTAAFRREPVLARTGRLQSQSSSAEGVECSS